MDAAGAGHARPGLACRPARWAIAGGHGDGTSPQRSPQHPYSPGEPLSHFPIDPNADRSRHAWLPCPSCNQSDGCPECQSHRNCGTHWQYLLGSDGTQASLQCPTCGRLGTADTAAAEVHASAMVLEPDGDLTSDAVAAEPASDREPDEAVVETISLSSPAGDVAVSADGNHVYVMTAGSVKVISRLHHIVLSFPIGPHPKHMMVSANGKRIFVTGYDGSMSIINTVDNTVKTLVAGRSVAATVSPGGQYIYLAHNGIADDERGTWVSVISDAGITVALLPVDAHATGMALSPDGGRLYVASSKHNSYLDIISVIDTGTYKVDDLIAVPSSPDTITATPDGSRLVVTHYDTNMVSIIELATRDVAPVRLDDAPIDVAISPDGTVAYVTNLHSLTVVDVATRAAESLTIGDLPRRVQIGGDGKRTYVTDFGHGTIWVLDARDNSVVSTVDTGAHPEAVALSADGEFLYVTDYRDGMVAVISTALVKPHSDGV
jgi:YVTN family beta-propeller protein